MNTQGFSLIRAVFFVLKNILVAAADAENWLFQTRIKMVSALIQVAMHPYVVSEIICSQLLYHILLEF